MSSKDPRRETLKRIFAAAVGAVLPRACLPRHLPEPPRTGRIIVLAAGKAAASMTAATEAHYLETRGLVDHRLGGLAVTRRGYGAATKCVPVVEAGHPMPDTAGLKATERTLSLARDATSDDLVLVLLSGGGSANWVAPAGRLTLAEKQAVTAQFLRSGATIGELNTVRKKLSRIKGGRLAALAVPARLVTLAISDVPRDDPSTIASGPTVPDPTTLAQARAIVAKRAIVLPAAARELLNDSRQETPKPGDAVFRRAEFHIVGRPAEAVAAAAEEARRAGYEPIVLGSDLEGEARLVAAEHAALARGLANERRRAAIISGGELTVTVTVAGGGRGGPNQEYSLALALALEGAENIAALAGDTDGTDGGSGSPGDPTGAFADGATVARGRSQGLDAAAFLAKNDSTGFFEPLGDLLTLGPTLTNVNDCRVILVDGQ